MSQQRARGFSDSKLTGFRAHLPLRYIMIKINLLEYLLCLDTSELPYLHIATIPNTACSLGRNEKAKKMGAMSG